MIRRGGVSFVLEGKTVNRANAFRPAGEWAEEIKRREDENVVSRIKLGQLVRAGAWSFRLSQADFARETGLHHNLVSRAVMLAEALDDGTGERMPRADGGEDVGPGAIAWARLDALRDESGRLPCLTVIEDKLGVRTRSDSLAGETRRGQNRHHATPAGSALGRTNTQWRRDGAGEPEQSGLSFSPPPISGPAGGRLHSSAGADGRGPEPVAGGRASTHAPRARVGSEPAPAPEPPHGVGAAGVQLTMDALYAGAVSDAERLLAALDELYEKDGLVAAKVDAARICLGDALGYLREAGQTGKNDAARRGETPHGVLSRTTTGASRAG